MSFNGWLIKHTGVHPQNGLVKLSNQKELSLLTTTCIDLVGIQLSEKKPVSKGYTLYSSIYKIFLK